MPHRSSNAAGTIAVTAGRFKDQSLELVRRVARTGEEVVITVRGVPTAKLIPAVRRVGNRFVGSGQQTIRIAGGAEALAALTGTGTPGTPELATPANPLALPSPGAGGTGDEEGPRRLTVSSAREGNGNEEHASPPRQLGDGSASVPHAGLSELLDDGEVFLISDDDELLMDGIPHGDC